MGQIHAIQSDGNVVKGVEVSLLASLFYTNHFIFIILV